MQFSKQDVADVASLHFTCVLTYSLTKYVLEAVQK